MTSSYDASLVILSVMVAMLASFAALDLAGRVRSEAGATRLGWISGGGIVMGLGIWTWTQLRTAAEGMNPVDYIKYRY